MPKIMNKKENHFKTSTEALGYLNRGGYYFDGRNHLSDETLIMIANDIYESKQNQLT